MQDSTLYTGMPGNAQQRAFRSMRSRIASLVLLLLVLALSGGSLYWLQWSSQQGLTRGYPVPHVSISSLAGSKLTLGQAYPFTANANGRDLTYTWDFGDQSSSNEASLSHTYQSNGSYTVTVTVVDGIGQTSSATLPVQVLPPLPTASFLYSLGYSGYVSFDASGSSADSSTSLTTYTWNFGDGSTNATSYSQDSHAYSNTGSYTVSLVVTDATGQQSDPFSATVVIS